MDVSTILSGLNIIDVIIAAILLLSLVSGMYKGFLSSALATLGFGGAVIGAYYFCPSLANLFQSNNGLMSTISYYIDAPDWLNQLANSDIGEAISNSAVLSQATAKLGNLPDSLVNAFRTNVVNRLFETLNQTNLGEYLSQTVIVSLVYVISFLLIFALCYVLALLVVNLLNSIFRFPLLKHLDWLLGGILGLVRGAFITMLVLTVIPMLLSLIDLNILDEYIETSKLAPYFSNDAILQYIIALGFPVQ